MAEQSYITPRRISINLGDDQHEVVIEVGRVRRVLPLGPDGLDGLIRAGQRVFDWCDQHPGYEPRYGIIEQMAPEWGIRPELVEPVALMIECHFEAKQLARHGMGPAVSAERDGRAA